MIDKGPVRTKAGVSVWEDDYQHITESPVISTSVVTPGEIDSRL